MEPDFLQFFQGGLMLELQAVLFEIKSWIWGVPLLCMLLGCGIYLTFILKGMQIRHLGYAIQQVFAAKKEGSKGDISPFDALMTSLAGAIGTGAIVGVSTAITIGGFGSLFWMWVTAILGMATKYAESLLAVKYRRQDRRGEMIGGPMYYIEKGLGWKWMAVVFCLFGVGAAVGTGNMVQVNAIAEATSSLFTVSPLVVGVISAALLGAVLIGGVKSIGRVAGILVPIMALLYLSGGCLILAYHFDQIPAAFSLIMEQAFKPAAWVGGVAGGGILLVIQMGVSRSVFTNEAGLGIPSIAAAAAQTDNPGRQAMITMTGALLSTVVICSITGLVLAVTGVVGLQEGGEAVTGASLVIRGFDSTIPGFGAVVSVGLILFAFSTIIAWAYYGEKCCEYLFGEKSVIFYRTIYTLLVIPGAILHLETVWYLADIFNGLMVVPNLLALFLLKDVILAETNQFLRLVNREKALKESA